MYFRVANDRAEHPTWWLYGSDDQMVAWAGEESRFDSLEKARLAAQTFKTSAATARYEVYQDGSRLWRWRAWRSSDELAASGESFYSQLTARRSAASVRDHASGAKGP